MKAIVIPKYGPPEVFVEYDLPMPEPRAGEILIRVVAAGVNFADLVGRVGLYSDAAKRRSLFFKQNQRILRHFDGGGT